MLRDSRRDLRLGVPERDAVVVVPHPDARPGTAFPTRELLLNGDPTFHLGPWCGTCPALFERVAEPERADLRLAECTLRTGSDRIEDAVLAAYGAVLPESRYTALLVDAAPLLIHPGDPGDYYHEEQVACWGIDPLVGGPADPGTPYYRTFEAPLGPQDHLFEFVVPMVPPSWNTRALVERQAEALEAGAELGTAVAYTLLDVLESVTGDGAEEYTHWTITHFLLDGHHRLEAAAAGKGRARLLGLLDERRSMASGNDVARMLDARARRRGSRGGPPPTP